MKFLSIALILLIGCNSPNKENKESKKETSTTIEKPIAFIGESLPTFKDKDFNYEEVEKHVVDLNKDGVDDSIILENIKDNTDPGDFTLLTISITNGENLELFNIDGWINTELVSEFIPNFNEKNLIDSKYITIKEASNELTLLFFKGYHYASNPGILTIVGIFKNKPVLIFNQEVNVFKFDDLNNDNIKDLVTIGCYKQFYTEDTPKQVYLLERGFTKSISKPN